MAAQLEPALLATDLADYLVKRGLPFREAHELVGRAVRLAESSGVTLADLSAEQLGSLSEYFGPDVQELFDMERSLASRSVVGGTAGEMLQEQLAAAEAALGASEW